MALVMMIVRCLLTRVTCITANESYAINFGLAEASASYAENPGVLAIWFGPDWAVVSKFVRPPPLTKALFFNLANARDIFISRFHELESIYEDVFLSVGLAMRRVPRHLMCIWQNKPSEMVDANEIG
jgi:hypothetical protein